MVRNQNKKYAKILAFLTIFYYITEKKITFNWELGSIINDGKMDYILLSKITNDDKNVFIDGVAKNMYFPSIIFWILIKMLLILNTWKLHTDFDKNNDENWVWLSSNLE